MDYWIIDAKTFTEEADLAGVGVAITGAKIDLESHSIASSSASLDIEMSKVGVPSLGGEDSFPEDRRISAQVRFRVGVEIEGLTPAAKNLSLDWLGLDSPGNSLFPIHSFLGSNFSVSDPATIGTLYGSHCCFLPTMLTKANFWPFKLLFTGI